MNYFVGEQVMIIQRIRSFNTTRIEYEGPYLILAKITEQKFKVRKLDQNRTRIVNKSVLIKVNTYSFPALD
jgi:hypothetical protein